MNEIVGPRAKICTEGNRFCFVNDIDANSLRTGWILSKKARTGIVTNESWCELIQGLSEVTLELVKWTSAMDVGWYRVGNRIRIVFPRKPACDCHALEIGEDVTDAARLDALWHIHISTNVDMLDYLLIQISVLIDMILDLNLAEDISISFRIDEIDLFDQLE